MSEGTDADASSATPETAEESAPAEDADGAEGAEATPEPEPPPPPPDPIEVALPAEAAAEMDPLVASLGKFVEGAKAFLETSHLDVAGIADALEPVVDEAGLAQTEELAGEWVRTVEGLTKPLEHLVTQVDEAVAVMREDLKRLQAVFADAVDPPKPPEPPAEEGEAAAS